MANSISRSSQNFMEIAISEAVAAGKRQEVPVGAIIVDSNTGSIVAASGNRTEELNDATAHAEMLVLRKASEVLGTRRLIHCDLYVTLEPCTMCSAAISLSRIRRLYYGAADPKSGGVEHGGKFFSQSTCHHRPDVYGGINEVRSQKLLKEFFHNKR